MDYPSFAFEETLKSKTKKDIIANKLVDMVRNHILRDGDVLPSEREMARLFGVSRVTVRGAVAQLAADGLVSISQGSNSRIRADRESLIHYQVVGEAGEKGGFEAQRYDIDSVYECRLVIEAAIARRAALKIDKSGIDNLERMLKMQLEVTENTPIPFQMSDKSFHKLISQYAGNDILEKYAEELYSFDLYVRRSVLAEKGAIERSYLEHVYIVEALKKGDPDASERAMLAHLDSVYRTTKGKIAAMPDSSEFFLN